MQPGGDTRGGLAPVLDRNIRVLRERALRERERASLPDRLADAITRFAGSMTFVALHAVVFGTWVAVNVGWVPAVPRFDESFVILGTSASVEAIFLSTFVLISQNRMTAQAERRADLDLQVSLLAEHEITRLAVLVGRIAERVGAETRAEDELEEIGRDVAPEAVLDRIEDPDGDSYRA